MFYHVEYYSCLADAQNDSKIGDRLDMLPFDKPQGNGDTFTLNFVDGTGQVPFTVHHSYQIPHPSIVYKLTAYFSGSDPEDYLRFISYL